jgi:hypothetical protein
MKFIINLKILLNSFTNFVLSILRIVVFTKPSIIYRPSKTSRLNPLIILGNGPSLKSDLKIKIKNFESYDFLAVNHFAESNLFETIKPSFYCIGAPELFEDKATDELINKGNQLFTSISQKTTWPLTLYLNSNALNSKRWVSIIKNNSNINIRFFNRTPVEGFFKYFFWRYNFGMVRPHNVLIPSLFIAINENFKSIYLFGADHSWLKELSVSETNEALLNQKHFYDANSSQPTTMRKDLYGKESRKLHEIIYKFYLSFKGYHEINKFAKKMGISIYNFTSNSFIDAFERK